MRFWCFVHKKEENLEATRMKTAVQTHVDPSHVLQALTASAPSFLNRVPDVTSLLNSQPALAPAAAPQAPPPPPSNRRGVSEYGSVVPWCFCSVFTIYIIGYRY